MAPKHDGVKLLSEQPDELLGPVIQFLRQHGRGDLVAEVAQLASRFDMDIPERGPASD